MTRHACLVIALFLISDSAFGSIFVPDGLQPGDMYHLVFVTDGARDGESNAIADYNAFVQAEAERSGAVTERTGAVVSRSDMRQAIVELIGLSGKSQLVSLSEFWSDEILGLPWLQYKGKCK